MKSTYKLGPAEISNAIAFYLYHKRGLEVIPGCRPELCTELDSEGVIKSASIEVELVV